MQQVRPRDYVVIKHTLKDANGLIAGVRFRGGYAVVEKGSKIYNKIKVLPLIKNQPELPLLSLRDLPFITRSLDIKLIFGSSVYQKYMEELHKVLSVEKEQKEVEDKVAHVEVKHLCSFITKENNLCINEKFDKSPSGYCKYHILLDPRIEEVTGLAIPKRLTKDERKGWKQKVVKALEKL